MSEQVNAEILPAPAGAEPAGAEPAVDANKVKIDTAPEIVDLPPAEKSTVTIMGKVMQKKHVMGGVGICLLLLVIIILATSISTVPLHWVATTGSDADCKFRLNGTTSFNFFGIGNNDQAMAQVVILGDDEALETKLKKNIQNGLGKNSETFNYGQHKGDPIKIVTKDAAMKETYWNVNIATVYIVTTMNDEGCKGCQIVFTPKILENYSNACQYCSGLCNKVSQLTPDFWDTMPAKLTGDMVAKNLMGDNNFIKKTVSGKVVYEISNSDFLKLQSAQSTEGMENWYLAGAVYFPSEALQSQTTMFTLTATTA